MCYFHSFLVSENLDFFEKEGEIHHSCIPVVCQGAVRPRDRMLHPEFDVASRRIDIDGQTLVEACSNTDPIRGPVHENDWALGTEALKTFEKYLRKRFNTAETLVEFAEPWWELAKNQLCGLVIWSPDNEPKKKPLETPTPLSDPCLLSDEETERISFFPVGGIRQSIWEGDFSIIIGRSFNSVNRSIIDLISTMAQDSGPASLTKTIVLEFYSEMGFVGWGYTNAIRSEMTPLSDIEWHLVKSKEAPKGSFSHRQTITLEGSFVFNWYNPTIHRDGGIKSICAYFSDYNSCEQLIRQHRGSLPGSSLDVSFERWAKQMLNGNCLSNWKKPLDIDYALGFSPEPTAC